jgi:hypothetical protein
VIDRESVIEHSVEVFLRDQLFNVRHYPQAGRRGVEFMDAYPTNERMDKPLDQNYVAVGWSADDGGAQAELGSPFKRRRYTFDFFVFGISRVWGKNLASVIRYSLESEESINLLDPSDPTNATVLGHVDVDFVSTQQKIANTARPWEENCWITRLRVEDYYSSAMGG